MVYFIIPAFDSVALTSRISSSVYFLIIIGFAKKTQSYPSFAKNKVCLVPSRKARLLLLRTLALGDIFLEITKAKREGPVALFVKHTEKDSEWTSLPSLSTFWIWISFFKLFFAGNIYNANFFLPFERRREMTARPDLVFVRDKKPNFLARLILLG